MIDEQDSIDILVRQPLSANGSQATPADVLKAAIAWEQAGVSVIPVKADGSKRPALSKWEHLQERRLTPKELRRMFEGGEGVAMIGGRVSDDCEGFDFDTRAIYALYIKRGCEWGYSDLMGHLQTGYVEQSPKGFHWIYRVSGLTKPPKSQKLALRKLTPEESAAEAAKAAAEKRKPADRKTLIETKSEGGYLILAPSTAAVGTTGEPYTCINGSPQTILTITQEEQSVLHMLARSFDEFPEPAKEEQQHGPTDTSGTRPGDIFARNTDWAEILQPHGYVLHHVDGETTHWTRPGKDVSEGASATTNHAGSDLFYSFSTSTVFEAGRGYGKFAVYTILNHNGDFVAAGKALWAEQHGTHYEDFTHTNSNPHDDTTEDAADPPKGLHTFSFGELRKQDHQRPAFICKGLGLRRGETSVLAGAGGSGKSLFALQLAASLAAGRPLFEGDAFRIDRPYRVAIYQKEESLGELLFRANAMADGLLLPDEQRAAVDQNLHFVDFHGRSVSVEDPTVQAELSEMVQRLAIDLLIIDPLSGVHSRSENDNAQMSGVLSALGPIQYAHGLHVMYVHHSAQTVSSDSDAARGGTAIRDACRALLRLQSHGFGSGQMQTLSLSLGKSNYVQSGQKITLNRYLDQYCFHLAPDPDADLVYRVTELVTGEGLWLADLQAALMETLDVKQTWARRVIGVAQSKTFIVIEERDNPETNRKKMWVRLPDAEERDYV